MQTRHSELGLIYTQCKVAPADMSVQQPVGGYLALAADGWTSQIQALTAMSSSQTALVMRDPLHHYCINAENPDKSMQAGHTACTFPWRRERLGSDQQE